MAPKGCHRLYGANSGVVKKELVFSVQPDPVSSFERYGVDFDDFAKYADRFNVVMFSKNYATPWYWEMLARGFKKLLKKPFYINLYVYGPGDNPKDVPTPAGVADGNGSLCSSRR